MRVALHDLQFLRLAHEGVAPSLSIMPVGDNAAHEEINGVANDGHGLV